MTARAAITPGGALSVRCETHCDAVEWNAFVRAHPDGSFFHLAGWGTATKAAYTYDTYYISVRRHGALAGILPLVHAKTPLLGASLVSTAFTVGGGPLADDAEALEALLNAAAQLGAEKKVRYIECRSDFKGDDWLVKSGTHAAFATPLLKDDADALSAISRKRRAEIRKAMEAADKGSLKIRHHNEPDLFYRHYAQSLHRLGTPVFPKRFLAALLEAFPTETEISIVGYEGEAVAALLSFYFEDAVLPYYVGATDKARDTRAFDYIYWAAMRRAAEKGCTSFDFGRSKIDSGAYQYKKLWGIEPRSLSYRVKLIGDTALPDITASNPKFAVFSKAWPRLPGFAANRIGPLLAPNFP